MRVALSNKSKVLNLSLNGSRAVLGVKIGSYDVHEFKGWELNKPDQFKNEDVIKLKYPKKTYESCNNLDYIPVTIGHPFYNIAKLDGDEKKELIFGMTGKAELKDDGVESDLIITDPAIIALLKEDTEVSWGGNSDIIWYENADDDGVHGEIENLVMDHLAILIDGKGRCGESCKVKHNSDTLGNSLVAEKFEDFKVEVKNSKNQNEDKKNNNKIKTTKTKGNKMKIILNGVEFEVSDEIGNAVNSALGALSGEVSALKQENDTLTNAKVELEEIKKKSRLSEVVNMAKEIDPDFQMDIENEKEVTILKVINKAMDGDETNEEIAYSAFKAFHKFHKAKSQVSNQTALDDKRNSETATQAVDSIYDEMFN